MNWPLLHHRLCHDVGTLPLFHCKWQMPNFFFFFFASDNVFRVNPLLCSPCWMVLAWQTSAMQRRQYRRQWSSSSLRRPQSFGPWLRRWWSRSVPGGSGRDITTARGCGVLLWIPVVYGRTPMESISTTSSLRIQRKNSVKSAVFRQRISLVRHGTEWSQSPVSSWLDPEACPYTWCSMLFLFYPTTALQIHRHIRPLHRQSLSQLMNGPVRKKLGIIPKNVTWGGAAFFNTHGPERIFAIIKNHFCPILFSLCVQARRKKCSATWREISWDLWWMWSTSCWAPESTSPSTTGSWIS